MRSADNVALIYSLNGRSRIHFRSDDQAIPTRLRSWVIRLAVIRLIATTILLMTGKLSVGDSAFAEGNAYQRYPHGYNAMELISRLYTRQ